MLKIHKQAKAEDDLINIWLYTFEKWGINQADHYLDNLNEALNNIAANPDIGTACDYIKKGYRKLHTREHYIFYRYTKKTVHVFRVLGNEMDYEPILQNKDS